MHPESEEARFDTQRQERGGGGGHPTTGPPRACILVNAPTNAQIDNLMRRVFQSAEQHPTFSDDILKDHPVPWMRPHAARGQTPTDLRAYNQQAVQETLANRPVCNGKFACALNSCRVVFATTSMVATRRRLLLGGPPETHKLGSHSASWMSPLGIASQWVWTWPLLGHSACFVGMPVNCSHTVPSLFWQRSTAR